MNHHSIISPRSLNPQLLFKNIKSSPHERSHTSNPRHRNSQVPSAASQTTQHTALSPDVNTATATVDIQDAQVFILGISHVSKPSCSHIKELIVATQPDVVLVELDKDRVPLLVDPSESTPDLWSVSNLTISGNNKNNKNNNNDELLSTLKCSNGFPVTFPDLDEDAKTLLSTGLFTSVKLMVRPPPLTAAPSFIHLGGGKMQTVGPIGEVEFVVKCKVKEDEAAVPYQPRFAPNNNNNNNYNSGRGGGVGIQLGGSSASSASSSGKRDSGTLNKSSFTPSVKWRPWSAEEKKQAQQSSPPSSSSSSNPLSQGLAKLLTGIYAKYQAAAGITAGITPGAAWRAALQAAAATDSVKLVLLGDRPAPVTAVRMADAVFASSALQLFGGILASIAGVIIVVSSSDVLGIETTTPTILFPATIAAAILPLAIGSWPIAAPLLEIRAFSSLKTASEVENAVKLKEPMQKGTREEYINAPRVKLWGEDALLDWPGAEGPIIRERDEFMARTIKQLVKNKAGTVPAYAAVSVDGSGRAVWRYLMPDGNGNGGEDGEEEDGEVVVMGRGDGVYECPDKVKIIVAVVGSAHVRGIAAELLKK
jgi:pheromone shutdown protein TraB